MLSFLGAFSRLNVRKASSYLVIQITAATKIASTTFLLILVESSHVVDDENEVGGKNKVTRVIAFSYGAIQFCDAVKAIRILK